MGTPNTQLEKRGSHALVPQDFKLQFGVITEKGYQFDPDTKLTPEQSVEEANRIAKGYSFMEGTRPFVIGTFVRGCEKKLGEVASQIYDLFGMKLGRLKNVLAVIDHVPPQLWNPNIAFEIHSEVAYIDGDENNEIKAALLGIAAEGTIDNKGEPRPLTVSEFKARKKVFLETMKTSTAPGAEGAAAPAVKPPTFHYSFSFRAMEPKESVKSFTDAVLGAVEADVKEAVKCFVQPAYAKQKAEKERATEFAEIIKGVPKADQKQFADLEAAGTPLTGIKGAVKKYNEIKKDADALDTLLKTVTDAAKRTEFQKMATTPGTEIKTVKKAVSDYNKGAVNVKAVNDALDVAKITKPEERAAFVAMLETDKKLGAIKSEIKAAGKTAVANKTRMTAINGLLTDAALTDEEKAPLLAKAHAGSSIKDIRGDLAALKSVKAEQNKEAIKGRREKRKTQREQAASLIKAGTGYRESATILRSSGDRDDAKRAEKLEADATENDRKANEMLADAERTEAEDKLLTGTGASAGATFAKPGKKIGKKKAKGKKR
jgi:hypothetical protein